MTFVLPTHNQVSWGTWLGSFALLQCFMSGINVKYKTEFHVFFCFLWMLKPHLWENRSLRTNLSNGFPQKRKRFPNSRKPRNQEKIFSSIWVKCNLPILAMPWFWGAATLPLWVNTITQDGGGIMFSWSLDKSKFTPNLHFEFLSCNRCHFWMKKNRNLPFDLQHMIGWTKAMMMMMEMREMAMKQL